MNCYNSAVQIANALHAFQATQIHVANPKVSTDKDDIDCRRITVMGRMLKTQHVIQTSFESLAMDQTELAVIANSKLDVTANGKLDLLAELLAMQTTRCRLAGLNANVCILRGTTSSGRPVGLTNHTVNPDNMPHKKQQRLSGLHKLKPLQILLDERRHRHRLPRDNAVDGICRPNKIIIDSAFIPRVVSPLLQLPAPPVQRCKITIAIGIMLVLVAWSITLNQLIKLPITTCHSFS